MRQQRLAHNTTYHGAEDAAFGAHQVHRRVEFTFRATVEYQHAIRAKDGVQPVGDGDHGAVGEVLSDHLLQDSIRASVHRRRG